MKADEDEILVESDFLDEADEQLVKFFRDLEKDSIKTLDDAARQIVGLVTTLLGLFFGVLAFKDNPAYHDLVAIQILGALSALCLITALFLALDVVMPRVLRSPAANLTEMRARMRALFIRKSRLLKLAQIAFSGGLVCLLGMILILLWGG